jgi:uncharacterized protein (DUF58 family)
VTARTSDTHVRDMIADHELELWLVFDSSASLGFGTGRATKHELGWAAAGALALLAGKGGNRVGAVTSGRSARLIPARSGQAHVAAVLAALREPPRDDDPGDLDSALTRVRRSARRRGMVVVVSDFLDQPTWARPLRALAQRHEVIAIEVTDERERTLPDVGLIAVRDPETGRSRLVDTADAEMRKQYAARATDRRKDRAAHIAAAGADHLVLRTDRDWVLDMVRFVTSRRARRQAAHPAAGFNRPSRDSSPTRS